MLKVFFDSEFTGLHQDTTLISIGLVSENGDTFYAEFNDYDESQCDNWIRENVIANLKFTAPLGGQDEHLMCTKNGKTVELYGNKTKITQYLTDWFYAIQDNIHLQNKPTIELWSDCLAYDFVLFNQLYGHAFNIPSCIYYIPFDICTLFKAYGIDPDINREEYACCTTKGEKHNALWDAQIIKKCHYILYNILEEE